MADFINCEADVDNSFDNDIEAVGSDNVSDNEFIDDIDISESVETYYSFTNVSRSYEAQCRVL